MDSVPLAGDRFCRVENEQWSCCTGAWKEACWRSCIVLPVCGLALCAALLLLVCGTLKLAALVQKQGCATAVRVCIDAAVVGTTNCCCMC